MGEIQFILDYNAADEEGLEEGDALGWKIYKIGLNISYVDLQFQ